MAERIKQILNEDPNKSYFFALGAGKISQFRLKTEYSKNQAEGFCIVEI